MRDTWPLLEQIPFPAIRRGRLDTLQVNVGYRCNQSCAHCHVNAGPSRTEEMPREVADLALAFLERQRIATLDITGGAPELNPHFRRLVPRARDMGVRVMDRCNLTILEVPGPGGSRRIPARPAGRDRGLDAVLPARTMSTASAARACSTARSAACNASTRWATAAKTPASCSTSSTIRRARRCRRRRTSSKPTTSACSASSYGIVFNRLYTLANMPIQRFGAILIAQGEFDRYLDVLQHAHLDANLDHVMCRNLISVDWRGYVYDCDFNQMLDLPLRHDAARARASRATCSMPTSRATRSGRRPLLRLHRRPGIELRRRAEGSSRVGTIG